MVISILIADDHQVYLDGLELVLNKLEGINVIGKALNGKQLVEMEKKLKPDVVITDIAMPLMDGIAATTEILKKHPTVGIIALSSYSDESLVADMFAAGARGYLVKNADNEEILQGIRTVYRGSTYYCKQTSLTLANLINKIQPKLITNNFHLTQKETEIIRLICAGSSNKEMAKVLELSVRTVEGYRKEIYKKTGEKSTAGLVLFAVKHKIYLPEDGVLR